jgi:hypothetical protein
VGIALTVIPAAFLAVQGRHLRPAGAA